jgi:hypothetical protein
MTCARARAPCSMPVSKDLGGRRPLLTMLALIEAQFGHVDKAVPILNQLSLTAHGTAVLIGTVRSDVERDPIRSKRGFKQRLQRSASQ